MLRKTIALTFILLLVCATAVQAGDIKPHSLFLIWDYESFISVNSEYVTISGWTSTYFTCNEVTTTIYLQYWNGSAWVDITSWSSTLKNTDYCSVNKMIIPPRGYYYRVRAVHYAKLGGLPEQAYTVTAGLYFS
ncbi:MAG TPA: hypothetical protein GX699_04830 [Firmicutes bacterium]|nr:hypothetical protein [Bacillota bacterium]